KPTQREYLGCLVGDVAGDTLFVRRLVHAKHWKQLQFAVAGDCEGVERRVCSFHTHPYRGDSAGRALHDLGLSARDVVAVAAAPRCRGPPRSCSPPPGSGTREPPAPRW